MASQMKCRKVPPYWMRSGASSCTTSGLPILIDGSSAIALWSRAIVPGSTCTSASIRNTYVQGASRMARFRPGLGPSFFSRRLVLTPGCALRSHSARPSVLATSTTRIDEGGQPARSSDDSVGPSVSRLLCAMMATPTSFGKEGADGPGVRSISGVRGRADEKCICSGVASARTDRRRPSPRTRLPCGSQTPTRIPAA